MRGLKCLHPERLGFKNDTYATTAMLDPIIALGLASNVVQLVDFTTKVLRKGSRKGSKQDLVDHARLTVITSDLRNQTENLKSSLFFRETSIETDENGKVTLHKSLQLPESRTFGIAHPGPGVEGRGGSVRRCGRRTPYTPQPTRTTSWPQPMDESPSGGYIGLEQGRSE